MHINHNDKHSPFWKLLPMVGLGPIRFPDAQIGGR